MKPRQPPRKPCVLVVGARRGSLGHHIAWHVSEVGVEAYRAGIATEPMHLDISHRINILEALDKVRPTHVVCTVGTNAGGPFYESDWIDDAADWAMRVNYLMPMRLLATFEEWLDGMPGTFVAISSNSAHIPRSSSGAYCASKAALSMGLRCAARDASRAKKPLRIWGYEPGALAGTPMTAEVRRKLGKDTPMSRMLTNPEGMPTAAVGRIVARDLLDSPEVLHGCMIRLDNGEI